MRKPASRYRQESTINGARLWTPLFCGFSVDIFVTNDLPSAYQVWADAYSINTLPLTDTDSLGYTFVHHGHAFVWVGTNFPAYEDGALFQFEDTAAHEAFHVALRASEFANCHKPEDAEEPLAYLVGTIVAAFRILRTTRDVKLLDKKLGYYGLERRQYGTKSTTRSSGSTP